MTTIRNLIATGLRKLAAMVESRPAIGGGGGPQEPL